MAQVNLDFPDLSQMFGAQSVMPAFLGMQRFQQAQQAQQGNMADQSQQMEIARNRAPVDLQHIMSQTEENRARVPYMQAQQNKLNDDLSITQAVPKQQRIDAAIAEYAAKTSEKEIKDHENAIRKGLIDPSPEVRKQAEFMWQQLDKVKTKKMELDNQAKIHEADAASRRASARDVAMVGASSRENVALTRTQAAGKHAQEVLDAVKAGKMDPAKAAATFGTLALLEEDPQKKAMYQNISNQMETMAQKLKPAPQPQIDPTRVPNAPLTTPSLPGPTVQTAPPAPSAPKIVTLEAMKKRYPNATEQQIRDAAKAKGIEIQ
jgi:type II secretory pathway pseudopilin PulG